MFNIFKKTPKPSPINDAEDIKNLLGEFIDPVKGGNIITSGAIQSFSLNDGVFNIIFEAHAKDAPKYDELGEEIRAKLLPLKDINKVHVIITEHNPNVAQPQNPQSPLHKQPEASSGQTNAKFKSIRPQNIGTIIAVASGKGGVGKSTIAFNIATGLARAGKKVGLLDADIYGPSVPTLMGEADRKADVTDDGKLIPIEKFGIKATSIGYIVEKNRALIWRGPMALKALTQFFTSVEWGVLDYLIIDLPPGTGDVPLSIAQQAHIDGVVVVATPQEVALADVRRGIELFAKANIPIIGLIENMSVLIDEQSGQEIDLFGRGGAKKCAEDMGIKYLGAINFYPKLRTQSDKGELFDEANPQFDAIINQL